MSRMDLELLNYVNMDMKWNVIKKCRTGMTRRPRKMGEDGSGLGNRVRESSTFERIKFGTEKAVDAPLKKRRLLHQSPSPTPQTPCVNSGPQTPAVNDEDSGQRCRLSLLSQSKKTKSKTRLRKSNIAKPKKNKVFNLEDFSGIELLAAAACSSLVNDSADHVDELSFSKEETTKRGINSFTVDRKEEAMVLTEFNASPIQNGIFFNRNEGAEKNVAPTKGLRLHWDLNTVMDEWEGPFDDLLVESHSQEKISKSVNSTLEGYGSKSTDVVDVEEKSKLDSVYANQLPVKHDTAISVVPFVGNCNGNSFVKSYGLIEDLTCPQKVMVIKPLTSKTSDGQSSVGKSGVVDSFTPQETCEDLATSTTSVLREQTIVTTEVMQGGCQSPRLCKSLCDNRVTSEDPLSEGCGSNVTQDEQGLTAEGDSEEKLESGYDSPFEDGELREPIITPFSEKEDTGTVENTLSEKVDNGQIIEGQSSLFLKETVPNTDIQRDLQANTSKSRDFSESKNRKDGSTSIDAWKNGEYMQRTRLSNFEDSFTRSGRELGVEKSSGRDIVMNQFHSRNYNPRGGDYRSQNRRHSPSERNNGYGSNRGPPVRNHSRDRYRGEYHDFKPSYFERKPHFPPKLNRPRSRSRSGSPIAWNFQKRKNSDTCDTGEIEPITSGHVSPERSSKFTDGQSRSSKYTDGQNRDKRRSPVRMIQRNQRFEPNRYPERLKPDDHFRYSQHSARLSQMTGPGRDHSYKDNNDAIRKHDSHYEKAIRLGRHDDGFRRFRDNDSFENRNRRNLDTFSKDSPKEQIFVTPPESRS